MKILVFISSYVPFYSGAAIQEHRVFRELASEGMAVEVVTLARPGVPRREKRDGVAIRRVGSRSRWGQMKFCAACAASVIRNRKRLHAVMALSAGWGQWFGLWLAARLGKPAFLRLSLDEGDDPLSIKNQRLGFIKLRLVRSARVFICLTPALVGKCRAVGIPQERIRLVPNAVDLQIFRPPRPEEKAEIRARLAIPDDCRVAIFVGALIARKGILELLDAWERVGGDHPRSLLLLCGPASADEVGLDASYLQEVQRRMGARGLEGRIRITGRLSESEVLEVLWAADLYVSMSRAEGLANAILEAMATGLPVLSFAKPGDLDGVIADGREGRLIEPGVAEEFIRILQEVLADPSRLEEMGAAAHARIKKSFSLDAKVDLYRALLGRDRPA